VSAKLPPYPGGNQAPHQWRAVPEGGKGIQKTPFQNSEMSFSKNATTGGRQKGKSNGTRQKGQQRQGMPGRMTWRRTAEGHQHRLIGANLMGFGNSEGGSKNTWEKSAKRSEKKNSARGRT